VATLAWTFVPEILIAGVDWLRRFEISPDILAPTDQTKSGVSNTAVLAMFLWQVALTVGLVMYVAAGLAFLSTASRTAERVFRQRSLGWRFSTLFDIAVDHDGRSGLVIAGTADFASFKGSRRKTILWARRGTVAAVAIGALWIVAAFAARSVLLILGLNEPATTTTLLNTFDSALILIPGILLVSCGFGFTLWERKILGKLGRRQIFDAEPTDVEAWYESVRADDAQPAPTLSWGQDRLAVWGMRIARLCLFLLLPVVAFALALGTVATLTAGRFSERFGAGAAELLALHEDIEREDPIGISRSIWTPYLPPSVLESASRTSEWLRRLRLNTGSTEAITGFGLPMADFFEWHALERRTITDRAFARAMAGEIPQDTLELLEFLANHPRTLLYRRLANASYVDILDESSIGDTTTSVSLRSLATTVTEAARANVLASVFEASLGDTELAVRRLGENAAIGEHLLQTPRVAANRLALSIMRNQVLLPLASLERARGDLHRVAQLERAAERLRFGQRLGNAAALAPDIDNLDRFMAAVTDRRVPAGYRLLWLQQGWAGLCAHPGEIILGPSSERLTAMLGVANAMPDSSLARRDAEFFEASWRWPVTTAIQGVPSSRDEVRLEDRMLMGTVFRVLSCAMPGNPF
jgi:hypothetical protein